MAAQAMLGADAVFSPCRTWRYELRRMWGEQPYAMFVGLNPSTADETIDDLVISSAVGLALGAHLVLVLLMVANRMFSITTECLNDTRTGYLASLAALPDRKTGTDG